MQLHKVITCGSEIEPASAFVALREAKFSVLLRPLLPSSILHAVLVAEDLKHSELGAQLRTVFNQECLLDCLASARRFYFC